MSQESRSLLTFLHLAKTGGRSVETLLRSTFGIAYCHAVPWRSHLVPGAEERALSVASYDHDDFRRLMSVCPGMKAIGGHAVTVPGGLHDLQPVRYFAFVRDPLKRAASHYQYHVATEKDPLDWAQWCVWNEPHNHQLKYFTRESDAAAAIAAIEELGIFVGLLEHFDESLLLLRKLVAPELNIAYLRSNVAERNDVARGILDDPVRREQLAHLNRREQPLYDHVANVLMPRHRAAYGPSLADDLARFQAHRGRGFNHVHDRLNRLYWKFRVNPAVRAYRRRMETTAV